MSERQGGFTDPNDWIPKPDPTERERKPNGPDHRPRRILTGAEFIARHVPPVWLIDGIVQRSRLYACTSLTGHGKTAVWSFNGSMIHAGRIIGQLRVFKGNVLILAGENPADLEARMIAMAKTYSLPLHQLPYVLPGSFPLNEEGADTLKLDIAALGVPFVLIIGDTAASFFPGEDENDNVQAGQYARTLRSFTECDGRPAVVVLSHPVKNASRYNLLPRGGGAFLNELDGNLALWSESLGEITELHWQGKIRGPDFSAFGYRLRLVPTGLTDENERPETTVVAEPMSEEAVADHIKQDLAYEDRVLRALRDNPTWSLNQIARDAGWVGDDGEPEKWRAQRIVGRLKDDKLIEKLRRGAPWKLTDKGYEAIGQPKAASAAPKDHPQAAKPQPKTHPTGAALQAEIDALGEQPEDDYLQHRFEHADRLGLPVPALTKRVTQARLAAHARTKTEAAATEPPASPTEAEIGAEIERLAEMSDAAFLALDREELAARLRCPPGEVATLRRRAQTAKAKAAAAIAKTAQVATKAQAAAIIDAKAKKPSPDG